MFVLVEGEETVKTGSAFFVSPTVLCTAGHVGYVDQAQKMFTTARHATSIELIEKDDEEIYPVTELGKGTLYSLL